MGIVDWASFSWEAFSTLFTGILAVGGAIYVGRRQVGISDRQSQILERQASLDALKYRSELFERRFEVYEATARYLGATLAQGDQPERDVERRFLVAMDASKFLFAPQVAQNLDAIWKECCAFFATKRVMESNYRQTGSYGEGMPDKELKQITALNDRFQKLSELFGDELKLADPNVDAAARPMPSAE
jgi:hypothetical protein